MDAIRELVSQVAAEAKLKPLTAKKAIYLLTLAQDGRTLAEAATALALAEDTVKGWCKRFDITLKDFDPYPPAQFPVRPKPKTVLKLHTEKGEAPLFGGRVQRLGGRCGHPMTAAVDGGKVYCCDCGREQKPKRAKKAK